MKNKLITKMGILAILSLVSFIGQAQTKSLLIGTVRNGIGVITNMENAQHALRANLPESSSVSDLKVEYSQYENKYYLTAKVSGNEINSVAIQLGQSGSSILCISGPGVELTCSGYNCADCRIAFSDGKPFCKCFQITKPTDYRCDMTSKIYIGL